MPKKYYRGVERSYAKRGVKLYPRHILIPDGCWTCGATGQKMSVEHVFPEWLLEKLNARNTTVAPTHLDPLGRMISTRSLRLSSLICGNVCQKYCNEGWMSELEVEFKRCYESGWERCIDSDNILIARWLAKTATILNLCNQRRVMVPDEARHGLIEKKFLPEGWKVYVFRCQDENPVINWMQGGPIIYLMKKTQQKMVAEMGNIFCCGLKIGNLGGIVYWHPPAINRLEPVPALKSIWPVISGELLGFKWNPVEVTMSVADCVDSHTHAQFIKELQAIRSPN